MRRPSVQLHHLTSSARTDSHLRGHRTPVADERTLDAGLRTPIDAHRTLQSPSRVISAEPLTSPAELTI
jgi:hypothetical protein